MHLDQIVPWKLSVSGKFFNLCATERILLWQQMIHILWVWLLVDMNNNSIQNDVDMIPVDRYEKTTLNLHEQFNNMHLANEIGAINATMNLLIFKSSQIAIKWILFHWWKNGISLLLKRYMYRYKWLIRNLWSSCFWYQ